MAARKRLVLIHSNLELRRRLSSSLVKSGHEVFLARMRADGLPLIFQVRPDLILLEAVADSEATWETFSRIRLFTDTPIILMADQPLGLSRRLEPKDNAQVIVTPISATKVISMVKSILRNRSAHSAESNRQVEEGAPVDGEDGDIRDHLAWLGGLLAKISRSIVPIQAVDENMLNHLLSVLNADYAALYEPNSDQAGWRQALKCCRAETAEWSAAQAEFVSACVVQAAETSSMVILDGPARQTQMPSRSDPHEVGLGPVVIVPLIGREQIHGALVLVGQIGSERTLTLTRIRFIMVVGESFALVMDNMRLLREVRQAAMVDQSTGVYSQGYLDRVLQTEAQRQNRYGRPFSVIRLKWVNSKEFYEAQGYQAYSEMLRQMALLARGQVRACDIVARGADEAIAFVLPETDLAQAQRVACRLGETLQASFSNFAPEVRPQIVANVIKKSNGLQDLIDSPLLPPNIAGETETGSEKGA